MVDSSGMLPLAFGLDFGGSVGLLATGLLFVAAFLVGRWVRTDADSRGMNGALWGVVAAVGCFAWVFPGVVVLAVYYVVRE